MTYEKKGAKRMQDNVDRLDPWTHLDNKETILTNLIK